MKRLVRILVISIILCTLIVIPSFATTGKVVNTDKVRFREKPSTEGDSKILGEVQKDTIVEILEDLTGWYKVQYDGKTGYINSDYLIKVQEVASNPTQIPDPVKQTTGNTLKILRKTEMKLMPLINSTVISIVDANVECTVITKAGNWTYVETSTAVKGWILNTNLEGGILQNVATQNSTTTQSQTRKAYVNTNTINVRKEPSTSSELVTTLTLNTEVTILEDKGEWYLVELDGKQVYIFKQLLSDSKK